MPGNGNESDSMSPPPAPSSMADIKASMRNAARITTSGAEIQAVASDRPGTQYFASGDDRIRHKQARNSAGALRTTKEEDPAQAKSLVYNKPKDAKKASINAKAKLKKMERADQAREERQNNGADQYKEAAAEDNALRKLSGSSRMAAQPSPVAPEEAMHQEKIVSHREQPLMNSTVKTVTKRIAEDGLAVAVAIEEGDENEKYLPAAVEFDPDSKPPLVQNRRFRLYGVLGCCLLILVIVVSIVASLNKTAEEPSVIFLTTAPTLAPSPAPTSARDSLYRSIFKEEVGDKVYEQDSAHGMAAQWIIHKDPMQLDADADNLIQRYILAFLYFHFTSLGTKPWRSCNPPTEGETDECSRAIIYFDEENNFEFKDQPKMTRWLTGTEECTWVGVICAESPNVVGLDLLGQKLSGSLPLEMGSLSFLQLLSFSFNHITGIIPGKYSELKHLISFELHDNQLTGTIPEEFYTRDENPLLAFNVGANLLTGTISTQVGLLTDLKGIHVFDNELSGSIPSEIGNLKFLAYARWNNNTITGTIPTEAFSLQYLTEWWMNRNELTGSIPTEIGSMTRLTAIRFDFNKLTGTVPEEMNLIQYRAGMNPIGGTIPIELSNIPGLRLAWLHNMNITGEMPLEVCANTGPGRLEFLQTDCFPFDNPTVPCRCCSVCCERDTKICILVV